MFRFTIPPIEWEIAHRQLDKSPDGSKLAYTAFLDESDVLCWRVGKISSYQITHSFVKIQGVIYVVAQGKGPNAIAGTGGFGKVKFVENEAGEPFVAKIEKKETPKQLEETAILRDKSYLIGRSKLLNKEKYYTIMVNLGKTLKTLMEENKLSDDERLDAAIDICWDTHQLHHGGACRSGRPRAHLDIKPRNITRDVKGRCHLIDFGLSANNPFGKKLTRDGTKDYLSEPDEDGIFQISRQQADVLALKRVMHFPTAFHMSRGFKQVEESYSRSNSLLTPEMLSRLNLMPYIDTGSPSASRRYAFEKGTDTPATLCALLISAKLKLKVFYPALMSNDWLGLAIAGSYQLGLQRDEIQVIADSEVLRKLYAVLTAMNLLNNKTDPAKYMTNDSFLQFLIKTDSLPRVCAFLLLEILNLKEFQENICASEKKSKAVLTLSRAKLNDYIPALASDAALARMLVALEEAGLEQLYPLVLRSPICYLAIEEKDEDAVFLTSLALFATRHILTVDDTLKIAQDKAIQKAIAKLHKAGLVKHYADVLSFPSKAGALASCQELGAFQFLRRTNAFSHYFNDNRFFRAFNKANSLNKACAIILIQECEPSLATRFFQAILADEALATAVCYLDEKKQHQYFKRLLDNPTIFYAIANAKDVYGIEAIIALLALDPTQASHTEKLESALQGMPSAMAAVRVLFRAKMRDMHTYIHAVGDSDLIEMILFLQKERLTSLLPTLFENMRFRKLLFLVASNRLVAHRTLCILSKFEQPGNYKKALELASSDEDFETLFKIADWQLYDAASLCVTKGVAYVSSVLVHATNVDCAIDYLELLTLLEELNIHSVQNGKRLLGIIIALMSDFFATQLATFCAQARTATALEIDALRNESPLSGILARLYLVLDTIKQKHIKAMEENPIPHLSPPSKPFYYTFFRAYPAKPIETPKKLLSLSPSPKPAS
jgi:serine/threonine protein kinase